MVLDLGRSTQYGKTFGVLGLTQDGYTTGRLTGIETSAEGVISARYTNGVVQPLGQVVMTNFVNPQGLQSLGDNVWARPSTPASRAAASPAPPISARSRAAAWKPPTST